MVTDITVFIEMFLQCFGAVGWATGSHLDCEKPVRVMSKGFPATWPIHGRSQDFSTGEGKGGLPYLPSPLPSPFCPVPSPSLPLLCFPPLEVDPLNPARRSGGAR